MFVCVSACVVYCAATVDVWACVLLSLSLGFFSMVCHSWSLQATWNRCGWVIISLYCYWSPALFSFALAFCKETVAGGEAHSWKLPCKKEKKRKIRASTRHQRQMWAGIHLGPKAVLSLSIPATVRRRWVTSNCCILTHSSMPLEWDIQYSLSTVSYVSFCGLSFFSSLLSLTSSLMTGRHLSKQFLDFWKTAEHFSVYETFYVISVALLFLKLHSSVLLLTVLLTELVIAFPPFVHLL